MRSCKMFLAVLLLGAAIVPSAQAQNENDYPNRRIRLIVSFTPGGGTDLMARAIAQKVSENWKQPVVVENRPGGNTVIGAELAARSAPDGYTLYLAINTTLVVNPSLYANLPYDPVKDFTPITLTHTNPMVLAVHPGTPAKNLAELTALAKASPGKLAYAYGAMPGQIAAEFYKSMAGIQILGVPYKGSAPAITDVLGGTIPMIVDSSASLPFIKSGQMRAIAVTSSQRSAALPDVPTMAEAGLPGYDVAVWSGMLAPAGLARGIQNRLNAELVRVLRLPDMRERFSATGAILMGTTPEELARVIQTDRVRYDKIIKEAGIRLE
ncbi:MAG: tripartite tricarboxylate transporter substrate binding protein [Betaproteobacteria bacterium]|nr:tripartite tricarboxylate transporter substrate binding protein [Betaproteobacteria bacterium]